MTVAVPSNTATTSPALWTTCRPPTERACLEHHLTAYSLLYQAMYMYWLFQHYFIIKKRKKISMYQWVTCNF